MMISATELDVSHQIKPSRSTTDRRIGSKSKVGAWGENNGIFPPFLYSCMAPRVSFNYYGRRLREIYYATENYKDYI